MQYFLVCNESIFILMMKNILILKNNLLYSANGEKVSKESITFLLDINEQYFLIDKNLEQVNESSFRNERDFHSGLDLLVTLEPSSDSIKKVSDNLITEHLDRNKYKKISYPIFVRTSALISFLESKDFFWNLNEAVSEMNYAIVSA